MSAPVAGALRMVRAEDVEERELAAVDREFVGLFGPDLARWLPDQVEQYLTAVAKVHEEFGAEPRCPRCQGTFETCTCTGVAS